MGRAAIHHLVPVRNASLFSNMSEYQGITYKPWPALPSPVVGYNVEVLDNPGGPEVEVPCGGGPLDVLEDQSLLSLGLGDPVVGLGSPVVHQGTFAAFALEFLYREHP